MRRMLKPHLTGLTWPVVPSQLNAATLSLVYQFDQSQWWSPDRLLEHQMGQIGRLLKHFRDTSPFYGERLMATGIDLEKPLDIDRFRTVPALTREDIQNAGDALLSKKIPKDHGRLLTASSSGSTGRPVTARKTDVNQTFHRALNLRNHLWHKRDLSAKFATIRGYDPGVAMAPEGKHSKTWTSVYRTGPSIQLNSAHCTLGEQVHWITKERPPYILSYPTNLHALALRCEELGLQMPWLKALITFSEALSPGQREVIEGYFGVPVEDMYSAAEVSMIAVQCPDDPENYHVQSENVLMEVVDDDGAPCEIGETGRILVTDLHNFAMPFIRYEIGDLAVFGAPCGCGRGLPAVRRVFGRVRNMLRLESGEQIFPDIAALHLNEIAPLRQYQMIQKSYSDIEMKLNLARPFEGDEEARMRKMILDALGQPFNLHLVPVEDIPRHSSGKFEDFISEVPA
jgi:phenylacetate-CoA ligase